MKQLIYRHWMHFSVTIFISYCTWWQTSAIDTKDYLCMQILLIMELQLHFHSYFSQSTFLLFPKNILHNQSFNIWNFHLFSISICFESSGTSTLAFIKAKVNLLSDHEPLQPLLHSCFSQVLTTLLLIIKLKGYDKQLKGTPWKNNKAVEKKCSTSGLKEPFEKNNETLEEKKCLYGPRTYCFNRHHQ